MSAVLHRSLAPFAFITTVTIALHQSVPELQSLVPSVLLGITALLLVLRPIELEIRLRSQFRTRVLLMGNGPLAQKFMYEVERSPKHGYCMVGRQ